MTSHCDPTRHGATSGGSGGDSSFVCVFDRTASRAATIRLLAVFCKPSRSVSFRSTSNVSLNRSIFTSFCLAARVESLDNLARSPHTCASNKFERAAEAARCRMVTVVDERPTRPSTRVQCRMKTGFACFVRLMRREFGTMYFLQGSRFIKYTEH